MTVRQLEAGSAEVENQYARVVRPNWNTRALQVMAQRIFDSGGGEGPDRSLIVRGRANLLGDGAAVEAAKGSAKAAAAESTATTRPVAATRAARSTEV